MLYVVHFLLMTAVDVKQSRRAVNSVPGFGKCNTYLTPSQLASMSFLFARDSPQMTGTYPSGNGSFPTILAICRTASRSSGLAIGKPASMISTPSFARFRAMSSFSLEVRVAPG